MISLTEEIFPSKNLSHLKGIHYVALEKTVNDRKIEKHHFQHRNLHLLPEINNKGEHHVKIILLIAVS